MINGSFSFADEFCGMFDMILPFNKEVQFFAFKQCKPSN